MASSDGKRLGEVCCYGPLDKSPAASAARETFTCPILGAPCVKNNDQPTGNKCLDGPLVVCSVVNPGMGETIVCPQRLYFDNYHAVLCMARSLLLRDGEDVLKAYLRPEWLAKGKPTDCIFVSPELSTPVGKIDWVGVRVDPQGKLDSFCWIEAQAIDTTGNYREARKAALLGLPAQASAHGLNWENVNKRITPQLIRKGTFLAQSSVRQMGIGLITEKNVFSKFCERLGSPLKLVDKKDANFLIQVWEMGTGPKVPGKIKPLVQRDDDEVWSTVENLCGAFLASAPWDPSVLRDIELLL